MIGIWTCLYRGFRRRCPQCGEGALYQGFYRLRERCQACGLVFSRDPIDILVFMYISTAFITGFFILGMFLIVPPSHWLGRVFLVLAAFALILLTLPVRKGVALALDYWIQNKIDR